MKNLRNLRIISVLKNSLKTRFVALDLAEL